ncbi:MAG: 30S ribosomal protein S6 [Terrimicrobiaceae bacterium]|nr:30S ribosomal protein S6 [Terrimicrobiaceae bacterium]
MKKRYEALLALNTRGKEDSSKEIIERLEREFAADGITVEQVQRLERREFAYPHDHQKSAYYVNFIIATDPATLEKLRAKLKLDADVTLQNYLVLPPAKAAA